MLCGRLVVGLHRGLINTDPLCGDDFPNPLLEDKEVVLGNGVSFGDDGDEIGTRAKTLHDLNVKRLQTLKSDERELV